MVDILYEYLFIGLIVALAVLIVFAIIKSIVGPRIADRVVSVNMISTMTVMLLCTLTVYFKNEGYLADVSIIFVLISLVSIIVLSNVFINVNMRKKFKDDNKGDK